MTDISAPLALRGLSKRFGAQIALRDASFELKPGEIFGLIGLNGAGKTTMIKIILDLLRADAVADEGKQAEVGTVTLFGVPASSPKARQALAYLPEKFQPSRYLKGMEYLSLSCSYYGLTLDRDAARTLAAALDLDPNKLDSLVKTYSKGMGQKLGLIGAMLCERPLLLLDEPMSGLDPSARIKLKRALLAQRDAGKSIFFSSHILSDIDEICDRIGVIHQGNVLFVGTPGDFKARFPAPNLEQSFLHAIGEDMTLNAA